MVVWAGASVVVGGVLCVGDCGRCGSRCSDESELFWVGVVVGGERGGVGGRVLEAENCDDGTCGNGGDGVGFCAGDG